MVLLWPKAVAAMIMREYRSKSKVSQVRPGKKGFESPVSPVYTISSVFFRLAFQKYSVLREKVPPSLEKAKTLPDKLSNTIKYILRVPFIL